MATSTTVPSLPPTRAAHREWNTPEILVRSRAALFGLTALLLASILFATATHRDAMTLVGRDTAPSIVKAQEIKAALAAMDAAAVDELLNPASMGKTAVFDLRRLEASDALMEAAKNVTYEAEKKPIKTIEERVGDYEELVQQARDFKQMDRKDLELGAYRKAALEMDNTLLRAADDLNQANYVQLENEYEARSASSLRMRMLVIGMGLLMLGGLVWAQLYLSRRTRRTLNPALAGATLLAITLIVFTFSALQTEQNDLREARQNAFASVHILLQARAIAYSANSDESRALLDPQHAREYQTAFDSKAAMLVSLPPKEQGEVLRSSLRSGKPISGFSGLLADALNNVAFAKTDGREAAETVLRFVDYVAIDKRLQALETNHQYDQALALDTGEHEGQSDWAFVRFDQELGLALGINEAGFKHAVNEGFDALKSTNWVAGAGSLVMLALIFFGYAPRIREYQ